MKTSDTHPIRVDFVDDPVLTQKSLLGLTLAPGKVDSRWHRDLEGDMDRLRREYQVDTLVTLLSVREIQELQLFGLFGRANSNGMEVLWMPLAQGKPPKGEEAIAACSAAIVERLRKGKRVVVHCSGGLGRSGLVAACCLIGVGLAPNAAMEAVRRARPGAIERTQERFVRRFRARALQWHGGQCRFEVFPVDPDVEAVLRSMLDELDVSTALDETLRGQIFERYLVGDEFPSTPLEAIHVLAVLRSSYVEGGDALARLGEVRLRRLFGSSLAVRSRISAKNTDGIDRWDLAYGSRAAELVEPITQFLLKRRRPRLPQDEDAILTAAALRFDGYAYADATGFDWQGWTPERYAAEGDQLEPLEILALFFAMQRFLCKWGGEMLPKTHGSWWMYRELFFRVVEIPVPSAYREDSRWVDWKLEYAPRLDECIEVVTRAHRATAYDKELQE